MRERISKWAVRLGAMLMTWGYVERGRQKGWTKQQLSTARLIAMQEENAIWDSIRGVILWNKSEGEIVASRLARRFDPGMTLNEIANRAIEAKKAIREEAGPQLTSKQLAALEFQKNYLKGVVDRS